jgi:hypothetical protein
MRKNAGVSDDIHNITKIGSVRSIRGYVFNVMYIDIENVKRMCSECNIRKVDANM